MRPLPTSLLTVCAETQVRESLEQALGEQYRVMGCSTAQAALERLELRPFSVVLCAVAAPGFDGEPLLTAIKASWPGTEVVMIAGPGDIQAAVRCMRLGAYDYITLPWDVEEMRTVVARAVEKSGLVLENALFRQVSQPPKLGEILGSSAAMRKLRADLARVSAHDAAVLLGGEAGSGKETAARAIHAQSLRRRERFVSLNCGSLPPELAEGELFGRERGAPGAAQAASVGKLEYASGGSLFLDDVDALPLEAQLKLLKALQEREICRLGSNRVIPVDVRILAATDKSLPALVRKGTFREDLYFRLSGVPVDVPALRDRGDDVLELFHAFMEQVARRHRRQVPVCGEGVLKAVRTHPFPGNVRELRHLVETLFVLSDGDGIDVSALPVQMILRSEGPSLERLPLKQAVREFERQVIRRTLRGTRGNQSRAADLLGIHRNTLLVKLSEFGLAGRQGEALVPPPAGSAEASAPPSLGSAEALAPPSQGFGGTAAGPERVGTVQAGEA